MKQKRLKLPCALQHGDRANYILPIEGFQPVPVMVIGIFFSRSQVFYDLKVWIDDPVENDADETRLYRQESRFVQRLDQKEYELYREYKNYAQETAQQGAIVLPAHEWIAGRGLTSLEESHFCHLVETDDND